MAAPKKNDPTKPTPVIEQLPSTTEIDVFCTKGDKVYKYETTIGGYKAMKRKPGWTYRAYQKGFCTMKPTQ